LWFCASAGVITKVSDYKGHIKASYIVKISAKKTIINPYLTTMEIKPLITLEYRSL
jgi:hypothetical protein